MESVMNTAGKTAALARRAYPVLVVCAILSLYWDLLEAKADLNKVQATVVILEARNTQLEERVVRASFQQAELQVSPFKRMGETVPALMEPASTNLTQAAQKQASVEEQRAADRTRFEEVQQQVAQRQSSASPPAAGTAGELPPGPLADLMAKVRRAP